jgi:putative ATPase
MPKTRKPIVASSDIFTDPAAPTSQLREETHFAPLAERLRPRSIDTIIGQLHLLGPGKPLRKMVESGKLHSMVLWGPPGTGKTTIANILAGQIQAPFYPLSAVSSSVKDLREAIALAEIANQTSENRSVLFIDEIHRFSKSQQDALLGAVEKGTVTLIGATTENPSFEVIAPLLSRARVFVLESLTKEDLDTLLDRALQEDVELREAKITLEPEARRAMLALSGGDARKLLNGLELAAQLASMDATDKGTIITTQSIEGAFGRSASRYDKKGEEHYNIISAFIKSMRGSDPNGAIYWLMRMIEAGEDIEFIARRMLIFASEDIGNADPNALLLAVSCWESVRAVGYPEARIIFSQVVAYLASAQKSNASNVGSIKAMEDVARDPNAPVPLHLRNAPTKLMKHLGYGEGYKYAHSFEGNFVKEANYLPEGLEAKIYYDPTSNGREKLIRERLAHLWPKKYGDK